MFIFVKIIRVLIVKKIKKCYIKINLLGFNIEIRNDLYIFIIFFMNEIYIFIFD